MNDSMKSNETGETKSMTFFEAIVACFKKYAEFTGRASRSEFWWFFLFITLISAALAYVNSYALSGVVSVALVLPFLAAGARRLHDTCRSTWWLLFILAPVGGLILLMILWAMPQESLQKCEAPAMG